MKFEEQSILIYYLNWLSGLIIKMFLSVKVIYMIWSDIMYEYIDASDPEWSRVFVYALLMVLP